MRKMRIAAFSLAMLLLVGSAVITADANKVYYVCNCKDNCACNFIAAKPGKCNCGSELTAMHLLAIEKSNGVFCRCGKDCTCERNKANPGKCGCGMDVKTASLKGKYICSCGTIADKPGKCHCGKDLKQVV